MTNPGTRLLPCPAGLRWNSVHHPLRAPSSEPSPPESATTAAVGNYHDGAFRNGELEEPALRLDVASASINRRTPMMKYVTGAALLVAFTVPGLATSSTTTATTGGSTTTTSEQYYLVRDPSTKKCTVTTTKPTSSTTVVVGDTVYKTRTEAEGAVKTTKVCTE